MKGLTKGLTLNFDVKNQIIYYAEQNQTVADSINYLRCRFTFTDDWDCGSKKYCLFMPGGVIKNPQNGNKPVSVPLVLENDGGYYCTVPFEVIKPPFFKLSVYCEGDEVLITSTTQKIFVRPSGYSDSSQEAEPIPPMSPPPEDFVKSGTWQPELCGSINLGNPVYAERRGTWSIVGNIYKINVYIELSSLGGIDGFVNIFGLPFNSPQNNFNYNANILLRHTLIPGEQPIGVIGEWIGFAIWENSYFKRYMNHNDLHDNSIINLSFEWQV